MEMTHEAGLRKQQETSETNRINFMKKQSIRVDMPLMEDEDEGK